MTEPATQAQMDYVAKLAEHATYRLADIDEARRFYTAQHISTHRDEYEARIDAAYREWKTAANAKLVAAGYDAMQASRRVRDEIVGQRPLCEAEIEQAGAADAYATEVITLLQRVVAGDTLTKAEASRVIDLLRGHGRYGD